MIFYPSKNHNDLNGLAFHPEEITGTVMVNPHHPGVVLADGTDVLIDSGAFQRADMHKRLHPAEALDRQTRFAAKLAAGRRLTMRLVTYDQLLGVDEALTPDGERVKKRGSERTAAPAVTQTLWSADYYAAQRTRLRRAGVGLCFAAQGATVAQYLRCTRALLDVMEESDWFGFGGFCIIGRQPSLKPQFVETVRQVLPLLAAKGIRRAHILGVCVHDALMAAAALGRAHGVVLSTDSSSIEINSVHGKVWDTAHMSTGRGSPWRKVYDKAHKKAAEGISYHPCTLALENIARFAAWSAQLATAAPALRTPIPAYVPPAPPERWACTACFHVQEAARPCDRCGAAVVPPAVLATMEDDDPAAPAPALPVPLPPRQQTLFPMEIADAA